MTTAHITSGLPASGKSSLARSLWPALRFNMDDARAMVGLSHDRWDKKTEGAVFSALLAGTVSAVQHGHDIVLDATHLTPSWPKSYRRALLPLGVEFVVHDLTHVPIEECIERDAGRPEQVGEAVIRRLADNHAKATAGGWRLTTDWMNSGHRYAPPEPYTRTDLPPIVICDIDGTVAINDGHRGHYDYAKVSNDGPNTPVLQLVRDLSVAYPILFLSGREDRCKPQTAAWLRAHFGRLFELHMRTTDDHRPDYLIKSELFDAHVRDRYSVQLVLDDRNQVVRLWRDMGLTCLQVADGDF